MAQVHKAVIIAGGYGSRLLPITKVVPKELLPVCGVPAVHYIAEELAAAGIDEILIVISQGKEAIVRYFEADVRLDSYLQSIGKAQLMDRWHVLMSKVRFSYVYQNEMKGTGDAIMQAESFAADEPIMVAYPDDITADGAVFASKIISDYYAVGACVLGCIEVDAADVHKYGILSPASGAIVIGDVFPLADIIEKPPLELAPSRLALIGRMVVTPRLFGVLRRQEQTDKTGVTPALKLLMQQGQVYGRLYDGARYDIGNWAGWLDSNNNL